MEPPPPTRISDVGVRAPEKELDVSLRLSCRALRIWRSDLHIRQTNRRHRRPSSNWRLS